MKPVLSHFSYESRKKLYEVASKNCLKNAKIKKIEIGLKY
jgi:hypothetical protein